MSVVTKENNPELYNVLFPEDEIKEILDKLQKVANRETASRNALMEMKDKDYQLLLDYITNLQEEYKQADYDRCMNYELFVKENEENKILKKDVEVMKNNYNLLVRCIENGESMTQKFENGLNKDIYIEERYDSED